MRIGAVPMPVPPPYAREKLVHAIVFFTTRTRACKKLKLFKLLFLFDFEIFRETGKSATGLEYFAWPMGPVPSELYQEFKRPKPDMKAALMIRDANGADSDWGLTIKSRVDFDDSFFTRRELDELNRLAEIFVDADAEDMTNVTHVPGKPWHRVFEVEKRPQALIPYLLALDSKEGSITQEQAKMIEEDAREAAALFK
jgi:uncharacterized phage-associated protein